MTSLMTTNTKKIIKDQSGKVQILMATYNGQSYIKEQLESIYTQSYSNIKVLVRDDASSDNTKAILNQEQIDGKIEILVSDKNIGAANSFFELLKHSSCDAEFYAFSDQDDIWYEGKIERAVDLLSESALDQPLMYFSRLDYVSAVNEFIKKSPLPRKVGFGNAIVENVATGCTIVLNRAARDWLIRYIPDKCLMHDSWCYLVISCFGEVLFDSESTIRYRQHSNNAIGAATSSWDNLIRRLKRFSLRKNGIFRFSDQAEKFLELYSSVLPEKNKALLFKLVAAKKAFDNRLCLALNPNIWRQSALDNLILRLLILFNRY